MHLAVPHTDLLHLYTDALRQGWCPNRHDPHSRTAALDACKRDPEGHVALLHDPLGVRPPITLDDGTTRAALPSTRRWILVDGTFAGEIALRWDSTSPDLPAWVLGHVGWHLMEHLRGRGIAPKALQAWLPEIWGMGLPYVDLAIGVDNIASQKAAIKVGAQPLGLWPYSAAQAGRGPLVRWRLLPASRAHAADAYAARAA
jgi:predicted acetyltransferase